MPQAATWNILVSPHDVTQSRDDYMHFMMFLPGILPDAAALKESPSDVSKRLVEHLVVSVTLQLNPRAIHC